jgi:pilus assembly protein Flp/PilA
MADGHSIGKKADPVHPGSFTPPRPPFLLRGATSMSRFAAAAKRFIKDESGATMVEYGLVLALIAIVAMGGAAIIGTKATQLFSTVGNTL